MSDAEVGPVLQARGLHKTFAADTDAPVRAVRGLDLDVMPQEFVAIVGPSGCGKTTLLHLLSGLVAPDHGTISIASHEISAGGSDARTLMRRRHIGMVFQTYQLLGSLTAAENVAVAMRIAGVGASEADVRSRDLLGLVALGERADVSVGSLSGGQRQRVAIARALANSPALLLADEPTGALDSAGSREISELFVRLHQGGQAIVLVTHDPELASVVGRVEHMRDGRLHTSAESSAA